MNAVDSVEAPSPTSQRPHQRKALNAVWQPFLQFKLLAYLLGTTAVVACMLGVFLYVAFSDMIATLHAESGPSQSYVGEMVEIQLVHLFRYCGALFVLYILLLAVVCVMYTHKLIGPFRPFNRHIDSLLEGDYNARVKLRANDAELFTGYADKLNLLAEKLQREQ